MKNLIIFLLLGITAFTGYAQSGKHKKVTESYCVKFKKDITKEYERKVDKGEMNSVSARKTLELVDDACRNAIQDGMSIQDFEEFFKPVTKAECAFENQLNKLMSGHSASDIEYVSKKLKNLCIRAVEDGDPKLLWIYRSNKVLADLGIEN